MEPDGLDWLELAPRNAIALRSWWMSLDDHEFVEALLPSLAAAAIPHRFLLTIAYARDRLLTIGCAEAIPDWPTDRQTRRDVARHRILRAIAGRNEVCIEDIVRRTAITRREITEVMLDDPDWEFRRGGGKGNASRLVRRMGP